MNVVEGKMFKPRKRLDGSHASGFGPYETVRYRIARWIKVSCLRPSD